MAVKKPTPKRNPDNPNTVLVLFLVFFVILSLGLGVWGYFGYAGQKKLRGDVSDAEVKYSNARTGERYHKFIHFEARLAQQGTLPKEEKDQWDQLSKEFAKPDGEFKAELSKPAIEKMIKDTGDPQVLGYDKDTKTYLKSFMVRLKELNTDNDKLKGDLKTAQDTLEAKNQDLLNERKRVKKFIEDETERATKNSDEALNQARQQPANMEKAFKDIERVKKEKDDIITNMQDQMEKHVANIKRLQGDLAKARETGNGGPLPPVVAQPNVPLRDPHALFLDISAGKTLWDLPLGKIARIDQNERQVYISLGSAAGVKPQLTFNVFGPSWYGRADKGLKGTIEVQRVVDAHTSACTITSLYDAEGREIAVNDPGRLRIQREADNPMKVGDLLFNLTWGTHVFLAGPVNWTGLPSNSPAEQMRHLQAFTSLLERQGVTVDGYIDLNDGALKGSFTPKTRLLIRGEFLNPNAREGDAPRVKVIHDAMQDLRKIAIEKGLFLISSDNYANVIGFRRPRSANDPEVSAFRPRLPAGGQGVTIIEVGGEKTPEKKDNGKEKEKEKKEKD